jgi:hypothetical protein
MSNFVGPWLDITVNFLLIPSTEMFATGLGDRTDFANWKAVISIAFFTAEEAVIWNEVMHLP